MISANRFHVYGADESKNPTKHGKCVRRERRLGRNLDEAEESDEQTRIYNQILKTRNRIDQLSSVGQYRRRRFKNRMMPEIAAEESDSGEMMRYYSAKASRSSKLKGGFESNTPLISLEFSERMLKERKEALDAATNRYAQQIIAAIFGNDQREIKFPVVKERDQNHMMNMYLDRYEQPVPNEN